MADHTQMLRDQGLSVPAPHPNPTIVIQNEAKVVAVGADHGLFHSMFDVWAFGVFFLPSLNTQHSTP
jgi:hypothetical protein